MSWQKYKCERCCIRKGVKKYEFNQDGFVYVVNLCAQCAEDTGTDTASRKWAEIKRVENELRIKDSSNSISSIRNGNDGDCFNFKINKGVP